MLVLIDMPTANGIANRFSVKRKRITTLVAGGFCVCGWAGAEDCERVYNEGEERALWLFRLMGGQEAAELSSNGKKTLPSSNDI